MSNAEEEQGNAEDWRTYSEHLDNGEFPGLPPGMLTKTPPETTPEGTALMKVNPDADSQVLELYQKGEELKGFAEGFAVKSLDDMKEAADTLSLIKGLMDAIEQRRDEYVRPLNGHVKKINASFKVLVAPMEEANRTLRGKVVAYQREQERIRLAKEEINRKRIEAAQEEMALKGELTEPVAMVEVHEPVKTYRSGFTTMSTRANWKWELEDLKKVPLEYLMIDSSKVGRVVKAGTRNIPGVRIYSDQGISVSPKREAVRQPPVVAPRGEALPAQAAEDLPF